MTGDATPALPALSESAQEADLRERAYLACERSAHDMVAGSMAAGLVAAAAVLMVLWGRVPSHLLLGWLALRVTISILRVGHHALYVRQWGPRWRPFHAYRLLCLLDGLAWSALGWAVTPLAELDIAVVTIGVLIGVAALAAFMLHVDMPAAHFFIVPIMLPNSLYALQRGDDLGLFCTASICGLMVMLLAEARRSNLRYVELLRLRFQSERLAQAQADALLQARQLGDAKSRFLATMSHEMRTPLHGMLGLVQMVRQRTREAESARQLDLVKGSGEHLVNVINDVLDFARLNAGGLPVHVQRFSLPHLMTDLVDASRVSAEGKGLRLSLVMEPALGDEVEGDPVRVRQVLHNLIGNAIKFTSMGAVTVQAWRDRDGRRVHMTVSDTGMGIPRDEQAHIFEAFHQAEGTYQRRLGGTGLGLTISRELARAMGGDLACRSEAGQGAVFTFSLALPKTEQARPVCAAPHPEWADTVPALRSAQVLLVEDNAVNALVAQAELARHGLAVTVVENGHEAVAWSTEHRADLILMDLEMPVMDGVEASRRIRAIERAQSRVAVPIVALTANGPQVFQDRCHGVGMSDYLCKPFQSSELRRILQRHLRMAGDPAGAEGARDRMSLAHQASAG